MDVRFRPHNVHWSAPDQFRARDPQLAALAEQPLVHRFPLRDRLPRTEPGIYSLTGGRQVGKSTLLKQHMADLLDAGTDPRNIAYIPGELIDDHHGLVRTVGEHAESVAEKTGLRTLILDEVTYVKDWDKGVKYLADAGLLHDTILLLTGSDTMVIREARMRFPGRRGKAGRLDFHLFPLSFAEFVSLKRGLSQDAIQALAGTDSDDPSVAALDALFEAYLGHGGYLTAINDFEVDQHVKRGTFLTYGDWIRGDMLKRGKREHFLREILAAILKRAGNQLTWNTLAGELSIDHPATVADYVERLARMDAAIIQLALREDKLAGAPKKARKIHFADPFIAHAVRAWLANAEDPYEQCVKPLLANPERRGALVESCAVSHFHRFYPTYYIKGDGEVDVAYVKDERFWPVEVKWTRQLRAAEFKQATKYPNSVLLARAGMPARVHGVACRPLVLALLSLGFSPIHQRDS